jgi:hypothetical protein
MLRLLVERDPVPLAVLSWIVTRTWPPEAMQPRSDVSFPTQSGPQPSWGNRRRRSASARAGATPLRPARATTLPAFTG